MNPTPQDLKAISEIQKLPVNISTDGLTAFMLIAQLQLALRHPGNTGETADRVKKIVIDLQNQLQTRSPDLKPILDQGWHPEFDVSTGEKIVDVHNVDTLYEPEEDDQEQSALLSFSRPQDWGAPRWNYEFIKLEWKNEHALYINNAHFWTTTKFTPPEILANLGQAVGKILQPGTPKELCGRTH